MLTLSFTEFAERYSSHLQAVFFFTAPDSATPRIPVGERMTILHTAWTAAVDAIASRLSAWTEPDAPADKLTATERHLYLLPDAEKRLPKSRIDACLMALVHDACNPTSSSSSPLSSSSSLSSLSSAMLADLPADLL